MGKFVPAATGSTINDGESKVIAWSGSGHPIASNEQSEEVTIIPAEPGWLAIRHAYSTSDASWWCYTAPIIAWRIVTQYKELDSPLRPTCETMPIAVNDSDLSACSVVAPSGIVIDVNGAEYSNLKEWEICEKKKWEDGVKVIKKIRDKERELNNTDGQR